MNLPGLVQILSVGDVVTVNGPCELRTTLGTCVAVCLMDKAGRVGGMNHYALAARETDAGKEGRYGDLSLPMLLEECMATGAAKHRLVAKIAGGGFVRPESASCIAIAKANIACAVEFLQHHQIPLVAQDTGDDVARLVRFDTATGAMFVRRYQLNLAHGQTPTVGHFTLSSFKAKGQDNA